MTAGHTTTPRLGPDRKPYDDEIDLYGLTHTGKVRRENQDHFLICALKKQLVVHKTSLPETGNLMSGPERLAFLMMVADGVGGGVKGAEASRLALEAATQYVSYSMRCYYAAAGSADEQEFTETLQEAAGRCHAQLLRQAEGNPEYRGMATTLTLYLGVWPTAYVLQVGDSRCYLLKDNELIQLSRDQTMAQELVDLGAMTPAAAAANAHLANTLSSSIGGRQTSPVVTPLSITWGNILLLCSDGLTKHVSDDRIRERLRSMKSARQVCEDLLKDALDDGGTDNITILVARALPRGELSS